MYCDIFRTQTRDALSLSEVRQLTVGNLWGPPTPDSARSSEIGPGERMGLPSLGLAANSVGLGVNPVFGFRSGPLTDCFY